MNDATGILFRDALFNLLIGFAVLLIVVIPYIQPIGKDDDEEVQSPGMLLVEIVWPPQYNVDVDLWVRANNNPAVGYLNQEGKYWNLLRDDLGEVNDPTPLNYENAYTRGLPEGQIVINVHYYASRIHTEPITVHCFVSKKNGRGGISRLYSKEVTLSYQGQEETVIAFRLDEKGGVVPGSEEYIQRNLFPKQTVERGNGL